MVNLGSRVRAVVLQPFLMLSVSQLLSHCHMVFIDTSILAKAMGTNRWLFMNSLIFYRLSSGSIVFYWTECPWIKQRIFQALK